MNNKVILAPSDTVWGLCGAMNREVFDELNRLKVRNEKPYLILAQSIEVIQPFIEIPSNELILKTVSLFWPGPLTVIFKASSEAPAYSVSKEGTIAFRIPRHDFLQEILKSIPLLFSTSANITGTPVASLWNDIDPLLISGVAATVVDDQNRVQSIVPSTIIDVSQGVIKLVREGAIRFEEIEKVFMELKKSEKNT